VPRDLLPRSGEFGDRRPRRGTGERLLSLECHTLSKGTHNNRERGGTREAPRTKTNTRESGVVPISFDSFLKIAGNP